MKRFLIPTFALALGCAAAAAFKLAPQAEAAPKVHKIAICHGTASAKNPYNLIIVDASAVPAHLAGHGKNNAPDFVLNGGNALTPQQEAYYRKLDDSACYIPPSPSNS